MKSLVACAMVCFLLWAKEVLAQENRPYIQVLGIAQDGGCPHLGCMNDCCAKAWSNDSLKKFVVSLALVDPVSKKWWLFEATPDIKEQLHYFQTLTKNNYPYLPEGIFLTHAHVGHYAGLMHLGREVLSARNVKVYCLPKMRAFLEANGPWSQLVSLKNIIITTLTTEAPLQLNEQISVSTFTVPHRDEYSETAGFKIITPSKKYLFIPDINKWGKWEKDIVKEVAAVDYAFLDATFYEITELKNRNIEEVAHPLVSETIQLFSTSPKEIRTKLIFIHFNHTNPLMNDKTFQGKVKTEGFGVAAQGKTY
ncbi:MAG: MBL fold metallo-hydrolase [Bacteroidia bacterium]